MIDNTGVIKVIVPPRHRDLVLSILGIFIMNICSTLNAIYGRDTRSAQVLSIVIGLVWCALIALADHFNVPIDLPVKVINGQLGSRYVILASIIFSSIAFMCSGKRKQTFKLFGLLLSSLFHAVIASAYIAEIPPLEPLVVICTMFSLWLLGAVYFVVRCEGVVSEHLRE